MKMEPVESDEPTYDDLVKAREEVWEKQRDRQRREWDAQRYMDREADPSLHGVWVIYGWINETWTLMGFRRRRKRRKPQTLNKFFAKARRRLEIDKKIPVKIMDLHEATLRVRRGDFEWLSKPPAFHPRRPTPVNVKPPLWFTTKSRQRAKVKAFKINKKETRFIVIARHRWERSPEYLYLGPLKARTRARATHEARKLYPIYNELLVLGVNELSEPLRHSMFRAKKIQAGKTRIQWPEMPPTFEEMWHRFLRWIERRGVDMTQSAEPLVLLEIAMRMEWAQQGNPWLTVKWMRKVLASKKIKPLTGDAACGSQRKPGKKRGLKRVAKPTRKKKRANELKKRTRVRNGTTVQPRSVSRSATKRLPKKFVKRSAPRLRRPIRTSHSSRRPSSFRTAPKKRQ